MRVRTRPTHGKFIDKPLPLEMVCWNCEHRFTKYMTIATLHVYVYKCPKCGEDNELDD